MEVLIVLQELTDFASRQKAKIPFVSFCIETKIHSEIKLKTYTKVYFIRIGVLSCFPKKMNLNENLNEFEPGFLFTLYPKYYEGI